MTYEGLFREFQFRIQEKRDSLDWHDYPDGYPFEEYQEGWRAAILVSPHG